ncbi:MAG TPA: 4-(cytidine 5'-diphospho)-2-C-methyl-D-erythritol kinase, partial [Candidatus Atribacteria bacterium]|nr:4-(cytidine 5'-diphospho)-2-C-methyl-D-erythritol kinase [Candidatus Atribacteria bacterium]
MRQISLRAPGKINWTLDIMGRRPDGYHEVRMLMQSVDLYDEITIMAGGTGITVVSDFEGMPLDERNTAWKAAALLMDMAGASEGVKISIKKRIPMAAGMAGGSADAAGVLVGLNELWGLGLNVSQLEAIGLEVGADVPFCIAGGTAIAEGIGEMLTRLEPIEGIWLVVVKPPFGVSTAEV